jgi:NAD-dependent deacetylase
VACYEARRRNPGLVLDFYNERRKAVREARSNAAHLALIELERAYDVRIVTQNVDDLYEWARSSSVLHGLRLSGEPARRTAEFFKAFKEKVILIDSH